MDWSDYIGIPFERKGTTRAGCDCWGLFRLVFREARGVDVPDLGYPLECSVEEMANCLEDEQEKPVWSPRDYATMEPFDILVLRLFGHPVHVGTYMGQGRMLHTLGKDSAVGSSHHVDIKPGSTWFRRIEGVYRYEGAV